MPSYKYHCQYGYQYYQAHVNELIIAFGYVTYEILFWDFYCAHTMFRIIETISSVLACILHYFVYSSRVLGKICCYIVYLGIQHYPAAFLGLMKSYLFPTYWLLSYY